MPEIVTVLASQMEKLRRSARAKRLRVVEGVAFRVEGENVCHAFTERPPYRPVGVPEPAFFVVGDVDDDVRADLASLGTSADSAVVVLGDARGDDMEAFSGPDLANRCALHVISPSKNVRSRGLLESAALAGRRVFIVGVGSFGSTVAVELAKAGVGNFVIVDNDRLEPGNVARHACGVADIGRFKTFAVRDAVMARNPGAVVETAESDINGNLDFLRNNVRACDLTICLTDERRSRFNCNAAAVAAGRTAIFARAITRAAGGDVFIYRTGGPCLACLFSGGAALGEDEIGSARRARADTPDYAPEGFDEAKVQPGLAADIAPIVQMVVKLALVELAPKNALWNGLREDFEAPFYIWANRRDEIYADWQPMKYFFNRNSIMRWYGVRVPRDSGCLTCSMT